jgi:ATP-dependent DNA ligase
MSIFVVQKHQARNLHYDFRLEADGVLKSWAVPKDYADFEGTIPDGEYGAGTVKIWDSGSFIFVEKTDKKLVFDLKGKILKGTFCLINFRGKNWLLFKK